MSEPVGAQIVEGWCERTSVELPFEAELVAAPDRYREVLAILRLCAARIDDGASPNDNLVVSREVREYADEIRAVAETLGLPVRIETQQQLSETLAFALVVGSLELAAATNPVHVRDVLRPLRRGLCLSGDGWPIPPADLDRFRDRFTDEQHHPEDWAAVFESLENAAADRVATAVRWLAERPEPDGDVLTDTVQELLEQRAKQVEIPAVRNSEGPSIVDGESQFRPVQRLHELTPKAGDSFEQRLELGVASPNWADALDAWRTHVVEQPGRMPEVNAAAIPVVDANDAQFAEADWVFLLGVNENEFPRIYDETAPGIRVDQHADLVDRELDQVTAALDACLEQLVVSYRYTATDGNPRSPSPLVDVLELGEPKRIPLNEPFPVVSVGSVAPTRSVRERRLLNLADTVSRNLRDDSAEFPDGTDAVFETLERRTENLREAIADAPN